MTPTLEILMLEDSEADARLAERALRAGGLDFALRRVETREEFVAALEGARPHVILTDMKLPDFDGRSALALARVRLPDTPVIMLTGTVVDEDAVELLRAGAADYLLKDRLSRLAPAVRRAIADAEAARARRTAEESLRDSELRYRRLFESARDGIAILDGDGAVVDANPALLDLLGHSREELVGKRVGDIAPVAWSEAARRVFEDVGRGDGASCESLALRGKGGATIEVELRGTAYPVGGSRFVSCNIRDVRERIAAQRSLNEQLSELRLFQRVTVDRELRLQEMETELARLRKERA